MARRTNRTFVYSQLMRWEPLEIAASQGRAWIKTLAKDDATGARTALIKFDPGFRQEKTVSNWPVDMYVIEGEMECGDLHFEKDTFHYRQAGIEYGPIACPKGITRLIFTADSRTDSPSESVFIQDVKQLPPGPHHAELTGQKRGAVVLRRDPKENITIKVHYTYEVGFRSMPGIQHAHDHAEESFLITGESHDYLEEIDGHILDVPGAYHCRRANESYHGDTVTTIAPTWRVGRYTHAMPAEEYAEAMETHSPGRPVTPLVFAE